MNDENIPTCEECDSQEWQRTQQYIATEKQSLSFAGSTPVLAFEETDGDNYETLDDWTCANGHEASDETTDLIFERYI